MAYKSVSINALLENNLSFSDFFIKCAESRWGSGFLTRESNTAKYQTSLDLAKKDLADFVALTKGQQISAVKDKFNKILAMNEKSFATYTAEQKVIDGMIEKITNQNFPDNVQYIRDDMLKQLNEAKCNDSKYYKELIAYYSGKKVTDDDIQSRREDFEDTVKYWERNVQESIIAERMMTANIKVIKDFAEVIK